MPPRDRPTLPYFLSQGLPEDEAPLGRAATTALSYLSTLADDFFFALKLFDYAQPILMDIMKDQASFDHERVRLMAGWMFLAVRDAAMTIWHFSEAIDGANQTMRRGKVLTSLVDWNLFGDARAVYRAAFPHPEGIRNAVAHRIEPFKSPEKLAEHAAVDGINRVGNLGNRTLEYSWKGKTYTCELSDQTLTKLLEVREMICAAVHPAHIELQAKFRAALEASAGGAPLRSD